MLNLKCHRKWVDWPEAGARFLLSPLGPSLRQKLIEEATDYEPDDKRKRNGKLNMHRFHELVAEHCLHDWSGISLQADDDQPPQPAECMPANKAVLLEIEPANMFVFMAIQGLDMHLVREVKAAGNDCAGSPTG